MTLVSVILLVSGVVCLALSAFLIPRLMPRDGKPPPRWAKTEARATAAALGMFALLIAGIALLIKGFFP